MRLRNVKNKEEILQSSSYFISLFGAKENRGKWKKLFKNDNPIFVEIGMGKGKFIIENAEKYPNINFVGVEKSDSIIAKCLKNIVEKLDNLKIIQADALFIDDIFDHEISHLYLNFSDPWPKKRHHLRRLSSTVFLEKYEKVFCDMMIIEMRTDNLQLYQYSLISFSQNGYILNDISFDFHHDRKPTITTEYEDKFSREGLPIYYLLCTKKNV